MRLLTLIFILADSAFRLIDAQTKPRITLIIAQYNDQPVKVTTKLKNKSKSKCSTRTSTKQIYPICNRMANKRMTLCRINVEHDYDPRRMDARTKRSIHKWLIISFQRIKKISYKSLYIDHSKSSK